MKMVFKADLIVTSFFPVQRKITPEHFLTLVVILN